MAIQANPAADHYLDLVRAFPLRPIRSGAGHNQAIATIEALADRRDSWGTEDEDYFLVLALLIERYETEIYGEPANSE
jgi:HTH-type transcriptional regulator/antitoxin HigA